MRSQLIYSKSLRDKAKLEDALTIARAELIALTMAVSMGNYIQNALFAVTSANTVYFTDSLLNLQRIQRGKAKCKPWEERRVEKVLDTKGESEVRFCPGVLNPSDLPSRGCTMTDLLERNDFWQKGPEFLLKDKSAWPKQPSMKESVESSAILPPVDNITDEIKIYAAQVQALEEQKESDGSKDQIHPDPIGIKSLLERCSSISIARKALVCCKHLFSKKSQDAPLSTPEVDWADLMMIRQEQKRLLSQEYDLLKMKVVPKSQALRNLPVYLDEKDDVIRLQSRMHTSTTLTFDYVNSIIIPKGILAKRLTLWTHQSRFHCSQRQTLNSLRQQFWILGGFGYVKELVRKLCKTPRCRFVKFASPRMSPLPTIRIDNPQPWRNVGIDYLGPLLCRHSCGEEGLEAHNVKYCPHPKTRKVWIALFTCLQTRAIHTQVVEGCSTREFLLALRRFVATCGRLQSFIQTMPRILPQPIDNCKL